MVPVPIAVVPSLKVTIPVGVPPLPVTIAVNVTDWPNIEGLADEVTVADVGLLLATFATKPSYCPPPEDACNAPEVIGKSVELVNPAT